MLHDRHRGRFDGGEGGAGPKEGGRRGQGRGGGVKVASPWRPAYRLALVHLVFLFGEITHVCVSVCVCGGGDSESDAASTI